VREREREEGVNFGDKGIECLFFLLGFSNDFPYIKSNALNHNYVENYVFSTLHKIYFIRPDI
jgi:hypothetical protein